MHWDGRRLSVSGDGLHPGQLAGPFAFPHVASTLFRSMLSALAVGLTLLVSLAAFLGADLFQLCRLF
jgi:hypothetical protein